MSTRGAPADGAAAGGHPLTPDWLARRLVALGVPLRGAQLCVAFSGGADSTALLATLAQLAALQPRWQLQLRAVHVDHALQAGSAGRARRARAAARRLAVPCTVVRRAVRVARGESVEAAARATRYTALRAARRPDEWLLLAHHADDQLETVLLQLLRGAGPAGLAASPERAGRELRPLLPLRRAALRAFLAAGRLAWIEDPSNADTRFDRNFLRRELLPPLLARWPGAPVAVARSARLMAEATQLLAAQADAQLDRARDGQALCAAALRVLALPARRNLLRRWLQNLGLPLPDERRLRELAGPLLKARADAQPCVRWPGAEVRRQGERLHAIALPAAAGSSPATGVLPPAAAAGEAREAWPSAGISWDWRRNRRLALPGGGTLELRPDPHGGVLRAALPDCLRVAPRAGGERLPGVAGSRRVKELLRLQGLPAWQRGQVPLVHDDNQLLAVGDAWIAPALAPVKGARGARLRLRWLPPV
jgi:tRNA(Ile)-lysidine synthase